MAENIYTVDEVIAEVRNNRQKQALQVLPYEPKVQQPDSESLKFVTDFAKKTGDFATLSLTDLKVVALTYQLEKQLVGVEHLKSAPEIPKTTFASSGHGGTPGFFNGSEKKSDDTEQMEDITKDEVEMQQEIDNLNIDDQNNESDVLQQAESEDFIDEDFEDQNSDDDDEDGGEWITSENIKSVKKRMGYEDAEEKDTEVACMTTDFAMQNVLKQIGLNVSALDGRIIKEVRKFILRCYTCFKTTSDATKIFCAKCGHKTLKRVSVSLSETGEQVVHLNPRYKITTKFKNQQVPRPQGGKHSCNPVIFEDQRIPHQRPSKKAITKTDALDTDYTSGYSPFSIRDLDSRSARLRTQVNIKQLMQNHEYDQYRKACKKKAKK